MNEKKIIFSGMQPTGVPTLGNYLGAFKNWATFQNEFSPIYCVVDLHAITVRKNIENLLTSTKNLIALYIACGLDPKKNTIYCQSHVSYHCELAWILNCFSYMGELSRMTQFKEKSENQSDNVSVGLFDYPVLQASDILLYQTNLVPVGADQKQHIELARNIAIRFNNIFGDVFTIPEIFVPKIGAKVMSLQNPTKKMSKSDANPNGAIYLLDNVDTIVKKIKKSVTDSDNCVRFDEENKPGISNLLSIYSAITCQSVEEVLAKVCDMNYGTFKETVAQAIVAEIKPIQDEFYKLVADENYLMEIVKKGAQDAYKMAMPTMKKVKECVGFIQY